MKKNILKLFVALICIISVPVRAQTLHQPYQFSYHTNVVYEPLSANATELIGSSGWDDEIAPFTLPFDFYYTGTLVQSWTMDTYGGLYPVGVNITEDLAPILGFHSDYVDRGNSWIGYEVTGNTGNRIARIEFRNMGYFADTLLMDYSNFQIWLYEGSNKIEYHAGPSKITPERFNVMSETGDIMMTGLIHSATTSVGSGTFHFIGRVNDATRDSTLVFDNSTGPRDPALIDFVNYGVFPPDGAVFVFSNVNIKDQLAAVAAIDERHNSIVFPNPVTDKLTIQLETVPAENAVFVLYDIVGRELLRQYILQRETTIPVASLRNGVYIASVTMAGKKEKTIRIVKQ